VGEGAVNLDGGALGKLEICCSRWKRGDKARGHGGEMSNAKKRGFVEKEREFPKSR